jgi:hypothetical protein
MPLDIQQLIRTLYAEPESPDHDTARTTAELSQSIAAYAAGFNDEEAPSFGRYPATFNRYHTQHPTTPANCSTTLFLN